MKKKIEQFLLFFFGDDGGCRRQCMSDRDNSAAKATTGGYEFYDSETKIEDELRTIEFKNNKIALIWAKGSRLGLLYSIEIPEEE